MTDVIAHDHLAITAAAAQRDEVFAHIVAGVRAGGLPVPTQVTFEPFGPGYAYVCLHLDDGDVLGVDRWAAHFGLLAGAATAPRVYELRDVPGGVPYQLYEAESDGPVVERPGPGGELVRERDYLAPPQLWQGWNVHVACRVAADPHAAGPAGLADTVVLPAVRPAEPVEAEPAAQLLVAVGPAQAAGPVPLILSTGPIAVLP